MKRIIAFIFSIYILSTVSLCAYAAPVILPDDPIHDITLGDVDGNGVINAMDYAMAKRHVMKTYLLTGDEFDAADMNGDGIVNASDYMKIKRIVMKTI